MNGRSTMKMEHRYTYICSLFTGFSLDTRRIHAWAPFPRAKWSLRTGMRQYASLISLENASLGYTGRRIFRCCIDPDSDANRYHRAPGNPTRIPCRPMRVLARKTGNRQSIPNRRMNASAVTDKQPTKKRSGPGRSRENRPSLKASPRPEG